MKLMTRLSEAFNSIKAKFTRTERAADAEAAEMPVEEELPQAENLSSAAATAEFCPERDGLPQEGAPDENNPADAMPGRMTDEYKAWLQQQRDAADAANADVNIDSVQ